MCCSRILFYNGCRAVGKSLCRETLTNFNLYSSRPLWCGLASEQVANSLIASKVILDHACREAQENGNYAAAFLLCAEGCRLLETLQNLSVTGELFASVNRLYADTISRLEAALSSTCADFEATHYCKVRRSTSADIQAI